MINIAGWFARKPLSAITAGLAAVLILVPLYQRGLGYVFLERLDYVDGTTLAMAGVLLLRGVLAHPGDTDSQSVSIALIAALSFLFTYEAIFKLSFYVFPWRMPPDELREFVLQLGVALTALTGFAFGRFRISRASVVFTTLFLAGWALWLLIGFPQLHDSENFYSPAVDVALTWSMIYALNRFTKAVLCLAFFFLLPGVSGNNREISDGRSSPTKSDRIAP